jgi:sigma-E factor negative regulatory protein RseC
MIQENGIVTKVDGTIAWVETQRKSACESCSANKGCGSAVLSKVMGNKRNLVEVTNHSDLRVGDEVVLGLEEIALVKGSFAVYMVPLLLMIAFAIFGEYAGRALQTDSEWLTILFAGLGIVAGIYWLRAFAQKNRCNHMYHPVVIKKGGNPIN